MIYFSNPIICFQTIRPDIILNVPNSSLGTLLYCSLKQYLGRALSSYASGSLKNRLLTFPATCLLFSQNTGRSMKLSHLLGAAHLFDVSHLSDAPHLLDALLHTSPFPILPNILGRSRANLITLRIFLRKFVKNTTHQHPLSRFSDKGTL